MKNTKIIAIANQKGGVAKTTTALNLGVTLNKMGEKVLLIDGDPQHSLSKAYMQLDDTVDTTGITEVMTAIINREPFEMIEAIHHNNLNDIDYIPADIRFSGVEMQLVNTRLRESVLQRALKDGYIRQTYDYVIIDCPPSLSMILYNELTAADEVIIPVEPETMSIEGIQLLLDTIADVREYTNPNLDLLGFVTTKTSTKARLHRTNIEKLTETFENIAVIGNVSASIAAAESVEDAKALALYKECPTNHYFNKLAEQYRNIANYITLMVR